jgi:catechol 2,3-dioxygenase-like lactoylglutathione lyase family enzyme
MTSLISIFNLAALLPFAAAWTQAAGSDESLVSMGHLHLIVRDVEASKKFWTALGATPLAVGAIEAAKFPGARVLFRKGDPSGGALGSVVNHVAFIVPNVQQSMQKWKAAGLKTQPGSSPQQGFVFTPDDLIKIEIMENASLRVPIAFHHLHFFVAEPVLGGASAVADMQSWYARMFGAKPGKRGHFDAADLPGVNLTFSKSEAPAAGTKGRALDHIGFEVQNLEAFCRKAETSGVKFDAPYTKRPELKYCDGISHRSVGYLHRATRRTEPVLKERCDR